MGVRASRQDGSYKKSALHMASEKGLADTLDQLLFHGADAALTDKVRSCVYMHAFIKKCTYSDSHFQHSIIFKIIVFLECVHEEMCISRQGARARGSAYIRSPL